MKKPRTLGFKPPQWATDQSIPIIRGKEPDSPAIDKLRVMLGNLTTWVMDRHPDLSPEDVKAIMRVGEVPPKTEPETEEKEN